MPEEVDPTLEQGTEDAKGKGSRQRRIEALNREIEGLKRQLAAAKSFDLCQKK